MLSLDAVPGLLGLAFPLMAGPGPNTVSLAASGAAFGFRRSLAFLAGVLVGTACVQTLVATGVTGLVFALPGVTPVLTVLAAAYIVYLAYRIATAPPPKARDAGDAAPAVAAGLALAFANPKAYAVFSAIFASKPLVDGDPIGDAVAKLAILVPLMMTVNTGWLALGAGFASLLQSPRISRAYNILMSVLLIATVWLAFRP